MGVLLHGDVRMALQAAAAAATACCLHPIPEWGRRSSASFVSVTTLSRRPWVPFRASSTSPFPPSAPPSSSLQSTPTAAGRLESVAVKGDKKPPVCTADELHFVAVPGTEWRLALWRYPPCPEAPSRNHPLVLLSGVGTNAIGFDLSPRASFARHMARQGFDTWIVEVRGAGLSTRVKDTTGTSDKNAMSTTLSLDTSDGGQNGSSAAGESITNSCLSVEGYNNNDKMENGTAWDESQLVSKLSDTLMRISERLSGYINDGQLKAMSGKFLDRISTLLEEAGLSERFNEIQGKFSALLEARQNSVASAQISELSQRFISMLYEGQRSVSPQLFDLQERFAATVEDFQKQLDLIITYDWDFDNYLEEDIPAALEYIKVHTQPKDGKVLAIGHSMGGILLYGMLSRYGFQERDPGLAAVVTLASSLDYTPSNSSLKLLLPLADPAELLNVPVIPLGALLSAAYPLSSRPPYVLSWLNPQISAEGMMHPELLEKLVLTNFCTIPAKLLLQLTTAFREGGLRNRTGTFFYKDHLHKCKVPVLAIAGDQDLICPPEAVYETVKLFPKETAQYKLLGKPDGPHYGHYDVVGCRLASKEIYPCIIEFLSQHD